MDVHAIQLQAEKMGENVQLGQNDMVRRVDSNGEALVWCRKCSGVYILGAAVDQKRKTQHSMENV